MEPLALQHLYRTTGFLAQTREKLEWALHQQDRDRFSQQLDLVFIDTTSTFVWRDQETGLRRRGHSRDRRPDQPQVVLCVAVDGHGWPIGWDILGGTRHPARQAAGAFPALVAPNPHPGGPNPTGNRPRLRGR